MEKTKNVFIHFCDMVACRYYLILWSAEKDLSEVAFVVVKTALARPTVKRRITKFCLEFQICCLAHVTELLQYNNAL